jgi:hypothetical protein
MNKFSLVAFFVLGALLAPALSFAQTDELKMTITPLIIKNNLDKGDEWASAIRVINNNAEPITVYTQVLDFKSREDGNTPEFIYPEEDAKGYESHLLSRWVDVLPGPIEIPAQQSMQIPFSIKLPQEAEPGGHYAAILVGTRPMQDRGRGTALTTSSYISSLLMINVKGDMIEKGEVREFSVRQSVYQEPKADFVFKFENKGNIHLQPQGEIKVFDMFGRERGSVDINRRTDTGNVLPKSVREWSLAWPDGGSPWLMGRYRAELMLTYGLEAKQTASQTLFFWVINYKIIAWLTLSLLLIIGFIVLLVKLSVRSALRQASLPPQSDKQPVAPTAPVSQPTTPAPVVSDSKSAALDLRSNPQSGRKRID